MREARNFPKHPLDMSKDHFSFISFMTYMLPLVSDYVNKHPDDELGRGALAAIKDISSSPTSAIKLYIGEFSTRYNKPKEDFTWKWTLTFSDFAPENFRQAFACPLQWKDPAKAVVIEQARSFQTNDEQKLWTALKAQPRPKGGGRKKK